jgi:hypothetical protein
MAEEFSGEPADFEIADGIVYCKWNGKRPDLCIPLRVFRANLERASRVVAEHDHGNVYRFPRQSRRKPKGKSGDAP